MKSILLSALAALAIPTMSQAQLMSPVDEYEPQHHETEGNIDDGYCRIYFDDDNYNGIGSLTGRCYVYFGRSERGNYARLQIRGEDYAERAYLKAKIDRRGRAYFRITEKDTSDWRSRYVVAKVIYRGDTLEIFDSYIYRD